MLPTYIINFVKIYIYEIFGAHVFFGGPIMMLFNIGINLLFKFNLSFKLIVVSSLIGIFSKYVFNIISNLWLNRSMRNNRNYTIFFIFAGILGFLMCTYFSHKNNVLFFKVSSQMEIMDSILRRDFTDTEQRMNTLRYLSSL